MTSLAELWTTIEIDGKPAELFSPGDPARHTAIYLHNASGQSLSVSSKYTELLRAHRIACICPWGGTSWWSDRIVVEYDGSRSAEQYLLQSVVPWLRLDFGASGPIGLFGISMGGQGALRLAFRQPELFPVVAAVAPAIEYHQYYGLGSVIDSMYSSKEACRQDSVPMHVNPHVWPRHIFFASDPEDLHWHRGSDRLSEKLAALGIVHECDLTTSAGGHDWTYFDAQADRAISFLLRGLSQEARRLL